MSYTVEWTRKAREQQLADIWLAAANRRAVTAAAHQIDVLLRDDPSAQGESRSRSRRILIVKPLVVMYKIIESQRRVIVFSVRPFKSRP